MDQQSGTSDEKRLAKAIRTACLQAALDAYEDASIRGLCHEGALECALGTIQSLDVETLVQTQTGQEKDP